jgi:hypothetical protein
LQGHFSKKVFYFPARVAKKEQTGNQEEIFGAESSAHMSNSKFFCIKISIQWGCKALLEELFPSCWGVIPR